MEPPCRHTRSEPYVYPEETWSRASQHVICAGRSNEEELTRLDLQDHLVTTAMGGVLPEQPNPLLFGRVLEFPIDFFDLVNLRFGMSYLRTVWGNKPE